MSVFVLITVMISSTWLAVWAHCFMQDDLTVVFCHDYVLQGLMPTACVFVSHGMTFTPKWRDKQLLTSASTVSSTAVPVVAAECEDSLAVHSLTSVTSGPTCFVRVNHDATLCCYWPCDSSKTVCTDHVQDAVLVDLWQQVMLAQAQSC